ncbi:hypothetical protein EV138_1128 [Kribbella voronezhensis]|uniref:Uncharacterized protein n=1 Tax=Kribbella voronezhensis TaxID=2512212 RepID=A0A4R7T6V9_9ACTN|nr:hypothetical protein [Kribbella voronezhensis]TDU87604.1 hypothetical protein EV138_1128 [Kribbella voronezhensis]
MKRHAAAAPKPDAAPLDLAGAYAERLGVETSGHVGNELVAQFEHLSQFVLSGDLTSMRPGAVSAEAATAYGELWVLTAFLSDACTALTGSEIRR